MAAPGLKIYFRNGINGTPEDWTPYLSTLGKIKPKVESDKAGEAGVIVFDKMDVVLEYKSGTPVYTAFNTDLTSVQRYIIEVYGLKTDKSETARFIGVINFQSLDWPDGEKKISFEVLDKLSALDIIAADLTRTNGQVLHNVNTDVSVNKISIATGADDTVNGHKYFNMTYMQDTLIKDTTLNNTPEVGSIIQSPFDSNALSFVKYKGKKVGEESDNSKPVYLDVETTDTSYPQPSGNNKSVTNLNWWSNLFNSYDVCVKEYRSSYNVYYKDAGNTITITLGAGYLATAFDAIKIIRSIYEKIWGNVTIINRTGVTEFPIPLNYFPKLINENPFGMHPLDALKMLADSMQCYIFINRTGELVIQNKTYLGTNGTTRTLSSYLLKKNGNKKYMWDKLVDEVEITVNSWVKDPATGEYLVGHSSLKKNANIKSRNPFKKEVLAISSATNTQAALDAYAAIVAISYFNFYAYRHWGYNISLKMNNSMFDWDLLDNITIDGIQYFFVSFSIDLMTRTLEAELASVQSFNYDFTQAHIALNDSNSSNFFSTSPGGSGSGVALNPVLTALSQLDTTRGIITQTNDAFFVKRKFKPTLNEIRIVDLNNAANEDGALGDFYPRLQDDIKIVNSLTVGGLPDAAYKLKVYGDGWFIGNHKVDGYSAIGGAADVNFKQKIYGHAKVTGNLTVDGDIYVNGMINQVNVADLNVADHAIRLNKGGDNITALDGGIEMLGTADALLGSIKYQGTRWLSDLDFDIAAGKVYKINNVEVLNATTLGANVVNSSLTAVGTLTTGVWHATIIDGIYLNYNTINLKVTANQLNTIQDIAITSSPTFANITLTGTFDQQGTGISYFGSQSVLPKQNYFGNLGALNKKWLTLHAAELWVETLVAQNTIATIGGRVLVGPTTTLVQDLAAGSSIIYVKHNQMAAGDVVYMEANGKVEFMAITAGPYGTVGNYYYSVTRNLDASGADDWYCGDAVFNTGQAGNGFIDLYSIRGVKTASQVGPTIVGNVRNSTTYNDWSEHWAIGNLNNLYGYSTNIYGVGLGKYETGATNITIDATNGYRIRNYITTIASWDNTGKIILGQNANSNSRIELSNGAINFIYKSAGGVDSTEISLDASGNASFIGAITAASGTIGGWTINSTSISKTYAVGSYSTTTSVSSNDATAGLDITTVYSGATKLIVHAGGYNDGGATRYGFCIWDAVNYKFLMNVGFGGISNNMVAKISGLEIEGNISSSQFSTSTSFTWGDLVGTAAVIISGGFVRVLEDFSGEHFNIAIEGYKVVLNNVSHTNRSITINASTGSISVGGIATLAKCYGVIDTAPTGTELAIGDFYISTAGVLCIYAGGSTWRFYNHA